MNGFFTSNTAHVSALYAPFLVVSVTLYIGGLWKVLGICKRGGLAD
jgi:hypothetical protein